MKKKLCLFVFTAFICTALIISSCKPEPDPEPEHIAVTAVSLDKTTAAVNVNDEVTLIATITPNNASNKGVTWTSSAPAVASVTDGVVKGLVVGTATITVKTNDGDKEASCVVTVNAAGTVAVTGVTVSPSAAQTIAVGASVTLTASVQPSTAVQTVTWTSSAATVASVANGVVTGVAAGTATITAASTTDPSKTATVNVTVTAAAANVAVTGVTLNKTTTSLVLGGASETLTATVAPANATNKAVTWASSDATVASVSAAGVVAALKAGTTNITVKTADGEFTATCVVTVTVPVPTGVTVNPTTLSLNVGASSNAVTASVQPAAAVQTVTWSTSDAAIATVTNGVVTAVKEGTATISATSTADTSKKADVAVTVNKVDVTSVAITNESPVNVFVDAEVTLTTTVLPANASYPTVTWTAESTEIATVTDGVVKGVKIGTTTITATADGQSATVTVNVLGAPSDGNGVVPATLVFEDDGVNLTLKDATAITVSKTSTTTNKITLEIEDAGTDATVGLYVNGVALTADTTDVNKFEIDAAAFALGSHSIRLFVTDKDGVTWSQPNALTFTVTR